MEAPFRNERPGGGPTPLSHERSTMRSAPDVGPRAERGWELHARGFVAPRPSNPRWAEVRSQDDRRRYTVDLVARKCTCPDHRFRHAFCKHLWAALLALPGAWSGGGTSRRV
jgi:hypothetical protein